MSASVNDWQNYVNDYETKMDALEARLNEKLNDPNVSAEEKTQARTDYERQKKYLEWVKQENETIQQTGVVPDSIMVPAMESGSGAYYWNVDGQWKLFNAHLNVPMNGGKITEEYTFIEAEHFNIVWRLYNVPSGIENNYVKHLEASGWPPTTFGSYFGLQADTTTAPGVWTKYFYWEAIDTKGNLTRQVGSWDYSSSYVWFPSIGVTTTPPRISAGDVCGIGSWNGQSGNSQYRAGSFISISIDGGEAANPWDFYDDNIKPTDPDNAAFPDGWSPAGPDNDPDDGPEKDEAPNKTNWGNPPNPHNGFEIPYTFVNYAAFSEAGLRNFASKLWDAPDDFWTALTIANKNNANWLDYFVSLRAYPYAVNSTGTAANIYVGAGGKFYLGDVGEDVYASIPQHLSYYAITLQVPKHYNNFLDFAPYTKAYIYLPFSGVWEVNPKFLYHTHVMIMLTLDITDGSGVWQVYRYADPESATEQAGNYYLILEKQCKIGVEIPLSGLSATTMASNIVNASLSSQQRLLSTTTQLLGDAASGNAGKFITDMAQVPMQALTDSTNLANANREIPTASGGMSGLAAANASVIPFITLIRPVVENPESFPHTVGHLVNKASKLEKLSGFTTCRNVDVSNVGQATDKEKAQLKQILEGGFYSVAG